MTSMSETQQNPETTGTDNAYIAKVFFKKGASLVIHEL